MVGRALARSQVKCAAPCSVRAFRRRARTTAARHAARQHLLRWDRRRTTATLAPRPWLAPAVASAVNAAAATGSRRAASSSTNRRAPAASPTCAGPAGWTRCWRPVPSSGHHGRGRTRSREPSIIALLRLASGRLAALGAGLRSSARDGARGSSAGRAPAPPAGTNAARRCVLRANAASAGGMCRRGSLSWECLTNSSITPFQNGQTLGQRVWASSCARPRRTSRPTARSARGCAVCTRRAARRTACAPALTPRVRCVAAVGQGFACRDARRGAARGRRGDAGPRL